MKNFHWQGDILQKRWGFHNLMMVSKINGM